MLVGRPFALRSNIASLVGLIVLAAFIGPAFSQTSVEQFYAGKKIDLIIGYTPGGTYDLYARLLARHMSKYIPGNPVIVPRNMPGGGSRVAATWVYEVAPRDGTVLATADQSLSVEQAMGDPQLRVDTTKLIYIGNPIAGNNTTVSWHTSGVKTIADAMRVELPVGATGASTSSQYPRAMNALLGTRFKVILGYPGTNDINLAMERGEVAGKGSDSWTAWKSTRPDWLRDHKINVLVQIGLTKEPDLPDVPLMTDLAKTDEDRAILKLLSVSGAIGRPIFTAPGVPPERVQALREAFDKAVKDPVLLDEAQAGKMDINPVSGEELQSLVAEIVATPKPVGDRLREIIGGAEQSTPR
jgi:tripartite-type tricarboxylate transporter receptor subunit TctC